MSDGALYHIPHDPDLPHPLGRSIVNHDPRNRGFGVRPLLAATRTRKPGPWWARHTFDQRGSSCTTQAATGLLLSSPLRKHRKTLRWVKENLGTEEQRHAFYLETQAHDPWPGGEPQYEGSSSDAPYKLLRERGVIAEWRWCFGVDDVNDTLAVLSAVTTGTVWLESMFNVDRRGYLIVDRNSRQVGGHEWLLLDHDARDDEYLALNSWSRRWGRNGRTRVRGADYRWLLEQDGDATTVVAA